MNLFITKKNVCQSNMNMFILKIWKKAKRSKYLNLRIDLKKIYFKTKHTCTFKEFEISKPNEWNHSRKSSEQIIQQHWSLWIRNVQEQHRLL